jgi:hypothetical protein
MGSRQDTVESIIEYASGCVSARKMFGEYALYCDGKVVALVCDDLLYLKPTAAGRALIPDAEEGAPFPGAGMKLLVPAEDWDRGDFLADLFRATAGALPAGKKRKG